MEPTAEHTTSAAAQRQARHRAGVAKRLQRIEVALDDLRVAVECVLAERQREQLTHSKSETPQ